MKIIITENQKYLLRRVQQFIDVVEDMINEYELQDNPWWCSAFYSPNIFLETLIDKSIEEFINQNWDFFHDESEQGGFYTDTSILYKIFEDNYGDYVKDLFTRKCGKPKFDKNDPPL
jgi:hypothetical protein